MKCWVHIHFISKSSFWPPFSAYTLPNWPSLLYWPSTEMEDACLVLFCLVLSVVHKHDHQMWPCPSSENDSNLLWSRKSISMSPQFVTFFFYSFVCLVVIWLTLSWWRLVRRYSRYHLHTYSYTLSLTYSLKPNLHYFPAIIIIIIYDGPIVLIPPTVPFYLYLHY